MSWKRNGNRGRYTYADRRHQGHSPFWAFLISSSDNPFILVCVVVLSAIAFGVAIS